MKGLAIYALLSCFALCSPAIGQTYAIYSNIGSGYPADCATASFLYACDPYYRWTQNLLATPFTATRGGNLGTISLDLDSTTTSPVTIGLYADSSGAPGTLLESWSADVPIGSVLSPTGTMPAPDPLTVLTSTAQPLLSAGTQYWLVLTETSEFEFNWFTNDLDVTGGIWAGSGTGALSQYFATAEAPAIQVMSANAAAPEPATFALLSVCFGTLTVLRSRKRREDQGSARGGLD